MAAEDTPSNHPDTPPPSPLPVQPVIDYYSGREPRLVTLRTVSSMEAQLARLRLEQEGIPCSITDENMSLANWGLFIPTKLLVLDHDLERANAILSQPPKLDEDDDGDYAEETWRCPQCHRRKVSLLPLPGMWRWLSILLLGLPGLFLTRTLRCNDCHHEWTGHL